VARGDDDARADAFRGNHDVLRRRRTSVPRRGGSMKAWA